MPLRRIVRRGRRSLNSNEAGRTDSLSPATEISVVQPSRRPESAASQAGTLINETQQVANVPVNTTSTTGPLSSINQTTVPLPAIIPSTTANNSEPAFVCNLCDKGCANKQGLTLHRKSAHPNAPARQNEDAQPSLPYPCSKCSRSFLTNRGLSAHFRQAHETEWNTLKVQKIQNRPLRRRAAQHQQPISRPFQPSVTSPSNVSAVPNHQQTDLHQSANELTNSSSNSSDMIVMQLTSNTSSQPHVTTTTHGNTDTSSDDVSPVADHPARPIIPIESRNSCFVAARRCCAIIRNGNILKFVIDTQVSLISQR